VEMLARTLKGLLFQTLSTSISDQLDQQEIENMNSIKKPKGSIMKKGGYSGENPIK